MVPRILLAGLDNLWAEKIKNISPPQFKLVQTSRKGNLCSQIRQLNPRLLIIGTKGANAEEGLSQVRLIKSKDKHPPIILITRLSCEARAVEAFRAGVDDYFAYPISLEQLSATIHHLVSKPISGQSIPILPMRNHLQDMIGESKTMTGIKAYLARIAGTQSTVLITGETGTGKDLAAEIIHQLSLRSQKPFVCINCAALPENLVESELFGHKKGTFTGAQSDKKGMFENAGGGTLFLDEIGEMSPSCQAKILRSIESKKVYPLGSCSAVSTDVRIVAATNKNPEMLIKEGKFREDLYYRLNVARIHMPPLRERKEDIPPLISSGIIRFNVKFNSRVEGLSKEAITAMLVHQWPGNVRELNNTLESAFINCRSRQIEFVDLPPAFTKKLNFIDDPQINERDKLLTVLTVANWNKTMAAKKLNWSRMRIYRALKRYHLSEIPQSV